MFAFGIWQDLNQRYRYKFQLSRIKRCQTGANVHFYRICQCRCGTKLIFWYFSFPCNDFWVWYVYKKSLIDTILSRHEKDLTVIWNFFSFRMWKKEQFCLHESSLRCDLFLFAHRIKNLINFLLNIQTDSMTISRMQFN